MKVVCFYWQGDRWTNDGLEVTYINHLFRGVTRKMTQSFDFICFTNEDLEGLDEGIEARPFRVPSNKGVLPRLFMFSGESGLFGHQVLAIDLDVIIVGSLKDIAGYSGPFCTRSKFKQGEEWKLDGDIMSFQANKTNEARFWTPFDKNPEEVVNITGGRERYWFRHVVGEQGCDRWNIMLPGQVVSYKRHVLRAGSPPQNARIVSCHGDPRPHQIMDREWVQENWK